MKRNMSIHIPCVSSFLFFFFCEGGGRRKRTQDKSVKSLKHSVIENVKTKLFFTSEANSQKIPFRLPEKVMSMMEYLVFCFLQTKT